MDAKRVDVKLYVQDGNGARVNPSELIPVFHGWIQRTAIADELLIDVADYDHVKDGPGVMLIGHEAQYGYDCTKGRAGLLYSQRRAVIDGGFREALAYSVAHALRAAALLEKDEALAGRLKFDARELTIRINDRLRAPNTDETLKAVEADVRAVLGPLFGADLTLARAPGNGAASSWQDELFTLHVRGGAATNVDALLGRLPN
jgi:hypothetical protein